MLSGRGKVASVESGEQIGGTEFLMRKRIWGFSGWRIFMLYRNFVWYAQARVLLDSDALRVGECRTSQDSTRQHCGLVLLD